MTLDECWEQSLAMWKHIAEHERLNSGNLSSEVPALKAQWMRDRNLRIYNDCFFCHYSLQLGDTRCRLCPGRLVDPEFDCENSEYDYIFNPHGFYAKLLELNAKRLAHNNK